MDALPGHQDSLWMASSHAPPRPAFSGEDGWDVAVIGAGITGLTAALLLKRAGGRVAVLEMGAVGQGVTGFTTAKITALHQLVYAELAERLGEERARVYGAANQAAVGQIAELVDAYRIDCAFERRPAVTWTAQDELVGAVRREADVAARLGLPVRLTDEVDLPFPVRAAVVLDDQAQFHPRDYLLALADAVDGDGSAVFERSRVVGVRDGDPCRLTVAPAGDGGGEPTADGGVDGSGTAGDSGAARGGVTGHAAGGGGTVEAGHVVVATHLPILDRGGFFAKAHPTRSYVLSARVDGPVPHSMSISAESPVRSLRTYTRDGETHVLVGGESHRPGTGPDEREHWTHLAAWAEEHFPIRSVDYRWSAQDYTAVDGLPYVGRLTPATRRLWTATGYRKWGMTNGTAAAMVLAALVTGAGHPWAAAFDAQRLTLTASARSFVEENVKAGVRFVADRGGLPDAAVLGALSDGDGTVVRVDGQAYAVSRHGGQLRSVSPVCTHLGCHVAWNPAEASWDCPCHGSRFDSRGTVLHGPATRDLDPKPLPES